MSAIKKTTLKWEQFYKKICCIYPLTKGKLEEAKRKANKSNGRN